VLSKFAAHIHVTVVGGNVTFNCSFPPESQAGPEWEHKAPRQSEFKAVHHGISGNSPPYPTHFAVDIGGSTARKLSYLTLIDARLAFAGKYRCPGGSSPQPSGVEELVVLC
jgi:hypothetical protein